MSDKKIAKKKEQLKEAKQAVKDFKAEVKEAKSGAMPWIAAGKALEKAEAKAAKLAEELEELVTATE